jgi:hypothetical protein
MARTQLPHSGTREGSNRMSGIEIAIAATGRAEASAIAAPTAQTCGLFSENIDRVAAFACLEDLVHEVLRVDAGVGHDLLQRPREDLLDLLERQHRQERLPARARVEGRWWHRPR